jgi:hypothetical protein
MARAKSAKQRRRKTALPAFGAAGVSLAMASGASANVAPATVLAHHPGAPLVITLAEEEIADVSLATFYVFDKENADIPDAGVQLARGCGGCGCRGCGGRGCAVARRARRAHANPHPHHERKHSRRLPLDKHEHIHRIALA